MNCINCKYIDLENTEYSKFCEGYIRFGCKINGTTAWISTEDESDEKALCSSYERREEQCN